mmetsp:Transcript_43601/g.141508  ORF Transcript_43601/g.141508 Transcript_43601/m.141508 type:complete len:287 (+) Transcript_43601:333-1193(+)
MFGPPLAQGLLHRLRLEAEALRADVVVPGREARVGRVEWLLDLDSSRAQQHRVRLVALPRHECVPLGALRRPARPDVSRLSDDGHVVRQRAREAALEVRHRAALVLERGESLLVDARREQARVRRHLARRPENHRDPEGGVDANVEECSSGESRLVQPRVERRLELEAERCADADDLADGALADDLADRPRDREEPRPHALHQEEVALLRRGDALGDLRCRHGERLLAQHVPASPKAEEHVVPVKGMRRRHVHYIHLAVRRQLLVAAEGASDAVLLCKGVGRGLRS